MVLYIQICTRYITLHLAHPQQFRGSGLLLRAREHLWVQWACLVFIFCNLANKYHYHFMLMDCIMFTCKLICCEKLEVHTHHLNETRSVERDILRKIWKYVWWNLWILSHWKMKKELTIKDNGIYWDHNNIWSFKLVKSII